MRLQRREREKREARIQERLRVEELQRLKVREKDNKIKGWVRSTEEPAEMVDPNAHVGIGEEVVAEDDVEIQDVDMSDTAEPERCEEVAVTREVKECDGSVLEQLESLPDGESSTTLMGETGSPSPLSSVDSAQKLPSQINLAPIQLETRKEHLYCSFLGLS